MPHRRLCGPLDTNGLPLVLLAAAVGLLGHELVRVV